MALDIKMANRLGFLVLGLTNNFAYVIMLSAAVDLINRFEGNTNPSPATDQTNSSYCNEHSTSGILLANTIPSLTTKLVYPVFFVGIPVAYKATLTAVLSAISFLMTGFVTKEVLVYAGVAFASFSSGLGESTYLSNSPPYGDAAMSGWSIGTGAAGLVGAGAYAFLALVLEIEYIMLIMLVVPLSMLCAYFFMITPVDREEVVESNAMQPSPTSSVEDSSQMNNSQTGLNDDSSRNKTYGAYESQPDQSITSNNNILPDNVDDKFDLRAKMRYVPSLSRYFLPLLLVYFSEYFINQGLYELIYYPEIKYFDRGAQYRWFQLIYQVGVFLSRSSLELFRIENLWAMSILQAVNALIFLAHVTKLIHLPNFYIVTAFIVYEGLLGGFTYANTFYRMKKELPSDRHEFAISTVTIADTLGIVIAGIVALQAYGPLCSLYEEG